MALSNPPRGVQPGDLLVVVRKSTRPLWSHAYIASARWLPPPLFLSLSFKADCDFFIDDFDARGTDELTLRRGDKIELIELDDGFGDGWFLGKDSKTGTTGLFPGGTLRLEKKIAYVSAIADI